MEKFTWLIFVFCVTKINCENESSIKVEPRQAYGPIIQDNTQVLSPKQFQQQGRVLCLKTKNCSLGYQPFLESRGTSVHELAL